MLLALNYPVGLHDLCLDSTAVSYFKPSHESPGAADLKPPFHWTAFRLRSWQSRIFSKIIPNRRGSVDSHLTLPVRFHYTSTTLPLRCCYDPYTTMKIWLRFVYADGDVPATLLRPWRWSNAFVAFLYLFYIESEIPIGFYYDLGASTALLPFLLQVRFVSFRPKFRIVAGSPSSGMEGGGGGGEVQPLAFAFVVRKKRCNFRTFCHLEVFFKMNCF